MGHPWELTLRQLTEKVWRDYGLRLEIVTFPASGSILQAGKAIYSLPGIGEDDILSIEVLERICDAFLLPRVDFHLDPPSED